MPFLLSSYVYIAPDYMVGASDFICDTYKHIHPSDMPLEYMASVCSLPRIFDNGTYRVIL